MKDGKTVAIVPGSFDPITLGHIDIVKRASERYDTVYLAVMINDQKNYMFSLDERELIARIATKEIDNVTVVSSDGMLYELAESLSADAIVKGYRNDTDYNYEMNMAKFNSKHYPPAKTILLRSSKRLAEVSSTTVRKIILSDISKIYEYMPKAAAEKTIEIILSKEKVKS